MTMRIQRYTKPSSVVTFDFEDHQFIAVVFSALQSSTVMAAGRNVWSI